jgi:hypothetical protein
LSSLKYSDNDYENLVVASVKALFNEVLGVSSWKKGINIFIETNLPFQEGLGLSLNLFIGVMQCVLAFERS